MSSTLPIQLSSSLHEVPYALFLFALYFRLIEIWSICQITGKIIRSNSLCVPNIFDSNSSKVLSQKMSFTFPESQGFFTLSMIFMTHLCLLFILWHWACSCCRMTSWKELYSALINETVDGFLFSSCSIFACSGNSLNIEPKTCFWKFWSFLRWTMSSMGAFYFGGFTFDIMWAIATCIFVPGTDSYPFAFKTCT